MNSSIALHQATVIPAMRAVTVDTNGEAALTSAGGNFIGIVQSPIETAHDVVPVVIERCVVAEAGGVFDAGDELSVDANGKFVKYTAPTLGATPSNTDIETYVAALAGKVAVALEPSTADGDLIQIIRL